MQITKGIEAVAKSHALREIKEIRANNIRIRMRKEFLEK